MAISSVSQIYNGLISNTNASTSKISAKSIESQQQDLLDKLSASSQQDIVSLSSLPSSQETSASQTYSAQGLLRQIQSNKLSNDALLLSDSSSGSDNSGTNGVLSSLQSVSTANSQSQQNAGTSTSTSTSTSQDSDLATAIKQNPAMAPALVQNVINQGLLSIFNK
jgi:hypothetical protein